MYTKYQIAPSKAVVGVDRPIKALSMHIQKPLRITKGNNSHRISPYIRLNSRKVRNDILYAKKTPLNAPESQFRGVFVQEDLTQPCSKLLRFIKNHENTDRARTSEGRIHVSLKSNRGAGKSVIVENPDHLFKIGLDSVDVTQFGYPDM